MWRTVNLEFSKAGLQQACSSVNASTQRWGTHGAKKVRQRLTEMCAADTLADVCKLPAIRLPEPHMVNMLEKIINPNR